MKNYKKKLEKLWLSVDKELKNRTQTEVDFTRGIKSDKNRTFDERILYLSYNEEESTLLPNIEVKTFEGISISVQVLKIHKDEIVVLKDNSYAEFLDTSDVASVDELIGLLYEVKDFQDKNKNLN